MAKQPFVDARFWVGSAAIVKHAMGLPKQVPVDDDEGQEHPLMPGEEEGDSRGPIGDASAQGEGEAAGDQKNILMHAHAGHVEPHPVALRHRKGSADPLHGEEDKLVDEYKDLYEKAGKGMCTGLELMRLREIRGQLKEIQGKRAGEAEAITAALGGVSKGRNGRATDDLVDGPEEGLRPGSERIDNHHVDSDPNNEHHKQDYHAKVDPRTGKVGINPGPASHGMEGPTPERFGDPHDHGFGVMTHTHGKDGAAGHEHGDGPGKGPAFGRRADYDAYRQQQAPDQDTASRHRGGDIGNPDTMKRFNQTFSKIASQMSPQQRGSQDYMKNMAGRLKELMGQGKFPRDLREFVDMSRENDRAAERGGHVGLPKNPMNPRPASVWPSRPPIRGRNKAMETKHMDAHGSTAHHHGASKEEDVLHPDHYSDPRDRHEAPGPGDFPVGEDVRSRQRPKARDPRREWDAEEPGEKHPDPRHEWDLDKAIQKAVSAVNKAAGGLGVDPRGAIDGDDEWRLRDRGMTHEPTLREPVAYGTDELDDEDGGVIPRNKGAADAVTRTSSIFQTVESEDDDVQHVEMPQEVLDAPKLVTKASALHTGYKGPPVQKAVS